MREIRMLRTMWRKLETGSRNGLRHRNMAKASGKQQLPAPVVTAPASDPTTKWYPVTKTDDETGKDEQLAA